MFRCKECNKKELYISQIESSLKLAMQAKEAQIKDLIEEVGYLRGVVDRLLLKSGITPRVDAPVEMPDGIDDDEVLRSEPGQDGSTKTRYGG